ncbi:GmrSD restriction endonuclease domain-containing protein [Streptomyces pseudogriseolus]|uniref:GmrSD restriction endonuclease domain-containing protein n=1 Tax=Streptomyces pseudogriseolus TaxID=36817 RepID=UPI003FA281B6
MQAKETLFADLMQGRTQQFQVPLYQRTYSWTEKQLKQLWNDIAEQAGLVESAEDKGSTHFLGSVVLAPSPQNDATFPRWLVVDGQQRLTTLSLALAAIRDHVAEAAPSEADRINEQYLINKWKTGDDRLRLLPTQADRAQFTAHIHGTVTGQGAGSGVATAYAFFRKKLVEAEAPAAPQDVFRIEQAITSRLALVAVTAERRDNVHRIFESLNNTGLKLSQADLLRNYLFMKLEARGEHIYTTYWLPLQNSLSNDELEQLMWLQLVLDGDDRVRRQDLYAAQQRRFEEKKAGDEEIEAYIRKLHRRSAHFRRLLHPEEEPDPSVREALRRLDAWQASATYPALMLLFDRRERGELDSAGMVRALAYIESFLVRRMICRVPTNNLNRIFQAVPGQLPGDVPVAEGLHRLLSSENRFWPDDAELRQKIRTAPFYQYGRWQQRKLVLQRLEESYGHPEPVDFAAAQLTVEHVMPQSPGDEWLRALSEEADDAETPEELHARFQHTLGNLTLTAVNAELSNHPFERKQDLLRGSHLEMNRRIAATERWGVREILTRADELANRAITLWPAPLRGVGRAERNRDWQLAHEVLAALPHGTWTSYGDLAAFLGSGAQAVGNHLANTPGVINAYRVLTSEGRVSDGFRWATPQDEGHADVRARLTADGIRFTASGAADPVQRLTADELASLLAGTDDDRADGEDTAQHETAAAPEAETRAERFFRQLAADDSAETVEAVRAVFTHWESLGGWIGHGAGHVTTSAYLMLGEAGAPGRGIWPMTLYPGAGRGGTAEVVFQYMAAREPFTDRALRAEFLTRLNALDGVDIPDGKLELRPNIRLSLFEKDSNRTLLLEALTWFRDRWDSRNSS